MEREEAQKLLEELREQVRYHSRKYYTEDDPEISDREYDMLYRRLEDLEAQFPELVTADSPTQKVGDAVYNTFAPVVHQVPLESLHDSFSEEELLAFDRRARWSTWWNPSSTVFPWPWNTRTAGSSGAPPGGTASPGRT